MREMPVMNLYLYLDRKTAIHGLDPRTKLFILLCSFVVASLQQHPVSAMMVTSAIGAHGVLSRSLSNIRRIAGLLTAIGILTVLLWSIQAKGVTPLFWRFQVEPLLYGISTGIKIDSMIVAGVIFLSTTKNEEVAIGLVKLGLPYSFSFAFCTALRLTPTIVGSAQMVAQAQKSRGLDLRGGGLLSRTKKYIPLLIPIFLTTLRYTNQLSMALESKAFRAMEKRTFLLEARFRARDSWVAFALILVLIIAILIRIKGIGEIQGLLL
jgi:energy-coupling factor transport system permease protein